MRFGKTLIIAAAFLSTSCNRSITQAPETRLRIAAELTNTFALLLPNGFTTLQQTNFSYSSLFERSQTTIYLQLLSGNSTNGSNLLKAVEEKGVTVANFFPKSRGIESEYAQWWRLDNYGEAYTFKCTATNGSNHLILSGFLFSTPSNRPLFLEMIESTP